MELYINITSEDSDIIDICLQYWDWNEESQNFLGTVKSIGEPFNLHSTNEVLDIVRKYSEAYTTALKCSRCHRNYIFRSRSDYKSKVQTKTNWICNKCKRKIRKEEREAEKAEKERKERLLKIERAQKWKNQLEVQRKQKNIIHERFGKYPSPFVDIRDMSLKQIVYFLTIVRGGISENLEIIYPVDTLEAKLTPSENSKYDLVKYLYVNDLLRIHPDSNPQAFNFNGDIVETFDLGGVHWKLPVSTYSSTTQAFIEEIETVLRKMEWNSEWHSEQLEIWYEIGLDEALEYLQLCLTEHQLPFSPGEKTIHVIKQVLKDYSIGQLFNFIWRAAKDAAAFKVRNKTTSQHAANTVVGTIQRNSERARIQGWEIKSYSRDYRCPQSLLSQVYFNTVIQIGDDALSRVPFEL